MQGLNEAFRRAPVTVILCGASIAIYALEAFFWQGGTPRDLRWWALSGEALAQGRWWTLVTHLFLHGNLLHLAVNVLALWFIGPEVEWMLGRLRYVLLYLASGVAGGLLQTAFSPPGVELIGASGAVCGVLLSFATAYPSMTLRGLLFFVLPVTMKARTLGWGLIAVSVLFAAVNILPQVGHLAHLGGALAGAALTWWWLPPRARRAGSPAEARATLDALVERVSSEGLEGLSRAELRQLEQVTRERGRGRQR